MATAADPQITKSQHGHPQQSPSEEQTGPGSTHKRTYQACLPCRRRKVRCDLGSVDEPGDPPCQRCRREKKDCVFSETRRKRKAEEDDSELGDDYVARNKRNSASLETAEGLSSFADIAASRMNLDATGAQEGRPRTLSIPKYPARATTNRDVKNETAAALFQNPIIQPADALRMLVDAASRSEIEERNSSLDGISQGPFPPKHPHTSPQTALIPDGQADINSAIDPAIMRMQTNPSTAAEADLASALQAWSSLRFVRAGWFTAREGLSYVDYFYEHLAPLTPIFPPDFSDYTSHSRMLAEEPMLTVTILTITSRYMMLEGPGSKIRSSRIHDKLWDYLQGMVTRMFWGQEQFGGGFCGAGGSKTIEEVEAKRRGLRSLGTAESLLLLSDWLPRSLHFPPGDDENEIIIPTLNSDDLESSQTAGYAHAGWTEPAIRSDRMCWSLIGMAYTLSWELGVFDSLLESKRWSPGPQAKTGYDCERADRIGRMLLVYVSQACGRLGYPNMMPSQGNETNYNFLKMDIPAGTFPGPYGEVTATDKIQRAWAELTALMRSSNTEMFESKSRTHLAIHDGSYMQFLQKYGPRMKEWKLRFDRHDQTEIPTKARTILLMEYEYTCTYINSLSLQAVVESCATGSDDPSGANTSSAHTPPALFSSKLVDIHKQNRVYIDELVRSARNVLRLAVEGLLPCGALHHAPVRTHFRILSGAMFLLKSFAVGGKESEVIKSIDLLDMTITALRSSVVDDVHLSLRIADLLEGLTSKIRLKFVRLPIPGRSAKRSAQTHRGSLSQPTSAPKPNSTTDRRQASVSDARTAQDANSTYPPNNVHGGPYPDDFYASLGAAPRVIDLKDNSITIMPPPDFGFSGNDLYGQPQSPHSPSLPSPGQTRMPSVHARTASFDASQASNPFSPTNHAPTSFSPISSGSGGGSAGGYDWLALDFNPLLAQGVHFGPGEHSTPHANGAGGHDQNGHLHSEGPGEDGSNTLGASPWAMGAFGPEISEGLEMLGALGALGWEDGTGAGTGANW